MAIRTTTVATTTTTTKPEPTPTRLYDYVAPAPIEPSRVTNYTFEELAPTQPTYVAPSPYPTIAPDTYAEPVYTPTQPYPTVLPDIYAEPLPVPAPAPKPRPRACPVDILGTGAAGTSGSAGAAGAAGATGATGAAGLPGAAGVYYAGGVTSTLVREITVFRGAIGLLEPSDSYSRGVIQGLQRALFAFAVGRGRGVFLVADGILNQTTVAMTLSAIAEIGLPPKVSPMPRTDEDIARNCRAYANHIARFAGVSIDFQPVATSTLQAQALPSPPSPPTAPAKLFSGRNITIGAVLVGGFALLRR